MEDPSRGRVFMYRRVCMLTALVFLLAGPAVRATPLATAAPKSDTSPGIAATIRDWFGSLGPALGHAGHVLTSLWQTEGVQIDPDGGHR